jgi:hypothetical protein
LTSAKEEIALKVRHKQKDVKIGHRETCSNVLDNVVIVLCSVSALALASFECEPPENNHEKERYKALK